MTARHQADEYPVTTLAGLGKIQYRLEDRLAGRIEKATYQVAEVVYLAATTIHTALLGWGIGMGSLSLGIAATIGMVTCFYLSRRASQSYDRAHDRVMAGFGASIGRDTVEAIKRRAEA